MSGFPRKTTKDAEFDFWVNNGPPATPPLPPPKHEYNQELKRQKPSVIRSININGSSEKRKKGRGKKEGEF